MEADAINMVYLFKYKLKMYFLLMFFIFFLLSQNISHLSNFEDMVFDMFSNVDFGLSSHKSDDNDENDDMLETDDEFIDNMSKMESGFDMKNSFETNQFGVIGDGGGGGGGIFNPFEEDDNSFPADFSQLDAETAQLSAISPVNALKSNSSCNSVEASKTNSAVPLNRFNEFPPSSEGSVICGFDEDDFAPFTITCTPQHDANDTNTTNTAADATPTNEEPSNGPLSDDM